jgi:hypothetical protein
MLARLGLLALAATTMPSGCFGDGRADAHNPGTALGTFDVSATVTANTCGAGALGEQSPWAFPIKLSRDPGALYWNNGQDVIVGTLAADNVTFSFSTSVIQNMRDPNVVGPPPCSVTREDSASGALDAATGAVSSFSGQLSYQFTPTAGSSCDDLVTGAAPVVAQLPCGFGYTMNGALSPTP